MRRLIGAIYPAPAKGFEIVPGNHDSMVLEPNVKVLAAHVRKTLDAAQESNVAPIGVTAEEEHQAGSGESTEQGVRYAS